MKFGESLNNGVVPEWEDQYVNYKQGKKLIKKIGLLQDDQRNSNIKSDDKTPLLLAPDNNEAIVYSDSDPSNPDIGRNEDGDKNVKSRMKSSIFGSIRQPAKDASVEDHTKKFMKWLDEELKKVNIFYIEREREVYEKFLFLQDQLYQLKEQREFRNKELRKLKGKPVTNVNNFALHTKKALSSLSKLEYPSLPSTVFMKKYKKNNNSDISMDTQDGSYDKNYEENRIRNGGIDFDIENENSSSESVNFNLGNANHNEIHDNHNRSRDYASKREKFGVPYLYARHHLKEATFEQYRSLSLLKSYKILNRTAFRKITKKYDKAFLDSICEPYLKKIDSEAYFQTSDIVDNLISHIEDIYITFFDPETSDRKHSLEKLKSFAYVSYGDFRKPSFHKASFTSGMFLGFGLPLFILGLYTALYKLLSRKVIEERFLLQIWGGFFLLNIVFILFGINLLVFDKFKINYKFIFEFNSANALDIKQYFLMPSFGFCLLSLVFWFSANNFWPIKFPGRDWPWLYLGIMLVIVLWPFDHFYASSRKWFLIAIWRLFLSGFYPVEFRDFFLGDILCSLTYTMGNISFFFCLYAHHWSGVSIVNNVCSSSRSRLMGFFSTLPSIFRLLQCIRRYMDTGDWFPHLANMTKYAITTTYYCMLSVYRINKSETNRIVFIIFAIINSLYTSTWDITMDWSLLQSGSKNYLLRDHLIFKRPIYYYTAMVVDVILRFQWIFYACFTNQIEQLAVTSFCIAFAELIRRFLWIFFRIENEHSTNVTLFRASKTIHLPYEVERKVDSAIKKLVYLKYEPIVWQYEERKSEHVSNRNSEFASRRNTDTPQEEIDLGSAAPKLEPRSTLLNLSDALMRAHIKDFQRRKTIIPINISDDEDEDDDDDKRSDLSRQHSENNT